ncbi:MAG: YkgJ family cysteine cluster protein [Planctomycetales bacterium]|nr:YkgJ family cysteine cluster protein [Planctomycetales bacterium]NIM08276.1 YkgJ family cysteine cluster protein [Planctomycetales bacterium]NIN07769.1 YkgJ family cysteine cluster protein [Planctomycetales bacterium]NIN76889.1 YkgJ family cysteine cluster protein [Planctomycetales bacterium]NIO34088.1 YkgJ family cysteine cluster protein [Planctomycetales bacterium]
MMSDAPWYKDGLQFQCTQCGNCCTGAPGYVWVNKAEIETMAQLLNMDVPTFEDQFVRTIGIRKSLIELDNFDCVFFDNKSRKCQVYSARPRQCRSWPFWDSNLRTPADWQRTCQICPGSGTGPLVPLEQVQQQAAVIKI